MRTCPIPKASTYGSLDRILKEPGIEKNVEHAVLSEILWHPEDSMDQVGGSLPFLFGHGAEHVISIQEVQEDKSAVYAVKLFQEVLRSQSIHPSARKRPLEKSTVPIDRILRHLDDFILLFSD
jgi:hypothetical protein